MEASKQITARDIPFGNDDERRFVRVADGHYQLTAADPLNTELEFDHVRLERSQRYAELTVRSGLAGASTLNGVLFIANVNLSSLRERDTIAGAIAGRTKTKADDWRPLVDEACIRVAVAERLGDPAVVVRDAPRRGPERWRRALGFHLPERLPSILFGDGDTLKTMTADAMALHLARGGVNVGIVDAEMTIDEHAERIDRLGGGAVPGNLVYLACSRPLVHDRDRIAETVRTHALEFLFFDSVGFLCHDKPESSESALAYFNTVRSLGVGSLSIAHTNKSEQGDQAPFGSVFWRNSCRALWYAKRAEAGPDPSVVDVGFYPRKFNLGQRPGAHAIRFAFTQTTTTAGVIEAASVDDLAVSLSIRERIRHSLKNGAKTIAELADQLEARPESVKRIVNRHLVGSKDAKVVLFVKKADDERIWLQDSWRTE